MEGQVNKLKGEFSRIIKELFKELGEMATKELNFIEDLRTSLLARQTMGSMPFFSSEQKERVEKATTITEFRDLIHNYSSFQNVSVIQHLVEKYGGETVKDSFDSYSNGLLEFRAGTRIHDYIGAEASMKDATELPSGFVEVKMKMGDSWDDRKLEDVETFRCQMCAKASIPQQAVIFVRMTMASIILVWGVDKSNSALSSLLRALDEAEMTRFDVKAVNCDAVSFAADLATPEAEDVDGIEQPSHASELKQTGES